MHASDIRQLINIVEGIQDPIMSQSQPPLLVSVPNRLLHEVIFLEDGKSPTDFIAFENDRAVALVRRDQESWDHMMDNYNIPQITYDQLRTTKGFANWVRQGKQAVSVQALEGFHKAIATPPADRPDEFAEIDSLMELFDRPEIQYAKIALTYEDESRLEISSHHLRPY
jgi:hypothetical protein